MRVSITEAKLQLTALVRRAEAGDEVILTRDKQDRQTRSRGIEGDLGGAPRAA